MSWMASSSERRPAKRTSRKSVSVYRSQGGKRARRLHSRRSQESGTSMVLRPREIRFRHFPGFGRRLEQRIFLEAEQLGRQVPRELASRCVVLLNFLVVPHPFRRDA